MSDSLSASPGGQPSTTQPMAGPWLSPNDVTQNSLPSVLPDMEGKSSADQTQKRVGSVAQAPHPPAACGPGTACAERTALALQYTNRHARLSEFDAAHP